MPEQTYAAVANGHSNQQGALFIMVNLESRLMETLSCHVSTAGEVGKED